MSNRVTLTLATAVVSGRRTPKWFKGFQACATLSMILVVAALAICLALENVAQKKMLRIVGVVVQGLAGVLPRFQHTHKYTFRFAGFRFIAFHFVDLYSSFYAHHCWIIWRWLFRP